jgi:hypothetical protein
MKTSIKFFVCALALSTTVFTSSAVQAGTTDTTAAQASKVTEGKSAQSTFSHSMPESILATDIPVPGRHRIVTTKKYSPEQKAAISGLQFSGSQDK